LDYLQERIDNGIMVSSLRVYIAAIGLFQERGGAVAVRLGSNPLVTEWLKGAYNQNPPVRRVVPSWQLGLVLNALMEAPYEPMARASFEATAKKTLFLLAICSAARSSELTALDVREGQLVIRDGFAILKTNPDFLPKVPTEANINREIVLKSFYRNYDKTSEVQTKMHSLCPVRALKYYLARSKSVRKEGVSQLFVTFATGRQGNAIARASTSRWLTDVIGKAYVHYGRTPPKVKAHSTRAVSTSMANLRGARMQDIYNAATWASGHAFVKHYRLDVVNDNMSSISSHVLGAARPYDRS
jgi:hypothetical protein